VSAHTPAAHAEEPCRFALDLLGETDAVALRHLAAGPSVRAKADAALAGG
jgi:hypothetical protein